MKWNGHTRNGRQLYFDAICFFWQKNQIRSLTLKHQLKSLSTTAPNVENAQCPASSHPLDSMTVKYSSDLALDAEPVLPLPTSNLTELGEIQKSTAPNFNEEISQLLEEVKESTVLNFNEETTQVLEQVLQPMKPAFD
jgi:hypothetical protein